MTLTYQLPDGRQVETEAAEWQTQLEVTNEDGSTTVHEIPLPEEWADLRAQANKIEGKLAIFAEVYSLISLAQHRSEQAQLRKLLKRSEKQNKAASQLKRVTQQMAKLGLSAAEIEAAVEAERVAQAAKE